MELLNKAVNAFVLMLFGFMSGVLLGPFVIQWIKGYFISVDAADLILSIEGVNMFNQMKIGTPGRISLKPVDAIGTLLASPPPITFDTAPSWTCLPAEQAKLVPSPDGLSCSIVPSGLGDLQIGVAFKLTGKTAATKQVTITITPGDVADLSPVFEAN